VRAGHAQQPDDDPHRSNPEECLQDQLESAEHQGNLTSARSAAGDWMGVPRWSDGCALGVE
jgi:hypothetical protein